MAISYLGTHVPPSQNARARRRRVSARYSVTQAPWVFKAVARFSTSAAKKRSPLSVAVPSRIVRRTTSSLQVYKGGSVSLTLVLTPCFNHFTCWSGMSHRGCRCDTDRSDNSHPDLGSRDGVLRSTEGSQTPLTGSHREREVRVAAVARGGYVVRPDIRRELQRVPSLPTRILGMGHCVDKRGDG